MMVRSLLGLALIAAAWAACPDTCAGCINCIAAGSTDVNSTFKYIFGDSGDVFDCSECASEACADCTIPYDCDDCTASAESEDMFGRMLFGEACYVNALTFYGGQQCILEAAVAGDMACKRPSLYGEFETCMESGTAAEGENHPP